MRTKARREKLSDAIVLLGRTMAAVLDALAPYLIQTIKDTVEDEVRVLLGVSGDIQKLGKKMWKMEA
ncbi:hypothetical protein U9M48_001645 [Paspalum notatum var. saurae]|uniref:Uncharacterized protein n=1 Tax=Paspalum notatum var. saurae TaxID=547442 RepID=A0AAQ3PPT9_PASNO